MAESYIAYNRLEYNAFVAKRHPSGDKNQVQEPSCESSVGAKLTSPASRWYGPRYKPNTRRYDNNVG